jgi:hypothetical protein
MTWYSDFSSVVRISDADLAALQIGGNVTYRPGVKMVKITTSPTVYAISKGGVLRPVASEAAASALYGSNWNTQIDDVSDAFFTNYSVGSAVASASDFNKSAELSAAQSINVDKNISGTTPSTTGTLVVTPAIDNPSSMTLPLGATGVNMVKFVVTNTSSAAVTVTNATVKRVGPGATTDFSNVYLYEGATRLTSGRTINSSTNEANFTGINLMLAAGQSRTLWVAVDIATNGKASDVQQLELESLQAGAATIGGLPVMGSNMTLSGASVGTLTIAASGSISDPKVGQTNVEVAEFNLTANNSEDVWFQRITLYQGGNLAASNLTNLKLEQAGNVVATATSPDSNLHVVFNLASPMLITKGAERTFQVFADIGGGARTSDTLKLYVEEQSDVYGVGATYGQGVSVAETTSAIVMGYDGNTVSGNNGYSASTVQGGQLTITFNGPSSKNIAANTKGVELFNFTLASQGNTEVKKLVLNVACSAGTDANGGCWDGLSTANYTNIKVINTATNQVYWGPQDLLASGSRTSQLVTFTDIQDLAAGSSQTFSVVADVRSGLATGNAVTVTLNAFGANDLRNLDNNTFVDTSAVVPSGATQGNQQSIVAPSLALSLASSPVSQSYVKGSTSVPFLGINLKAGDGADIKVTSLTIRGFISTNGIVAMTAGTNGSGAAQVAVSDDILTCKLFDGSTQIGDAKSPTTGAGGLLQFTSINYTVPMSSTKTLTLKCDTSNSAFRNTDVEKIGFALLHGDVTAQDPSGNSLVMTYAGDVNATGTSPAVTITNAGSVTAQLAPDDTESQNSLVVAGDSSSVLGKWRFTASNEELNLSKLTFKLADNSAYRSISSVSLYDGSTLLAGPTSLTTGGTTSAQFSGMTEVIPKDSSKTLTLKATLNTISNGAAMGDNLKMELWIPGTTLGDTSEFEARGTSSSTVIRLATTAGDIAIYGNDKLVRKTKPTIALASLPTSIVSNGGGIVLARFTVTADAQENISLKKLSFKVSMNGTAAEAVSTPAIREVGQGSDISSASATVDTAGNNYCGFGATSSQLACVRVVFGSEQVITAGASKTYELRMTTANFSASGDSVSTILLGDNVNAVGALSASAMGIDTTVNTPNIGASGDYNFVWSDNSKIPHNDSVGGSADWTNGNYVKQLPGDAQTMTRS